MSNFLMLAMCFAAGLVLRRSGRAPAMIGIGIPLGMLTAVAWHPLFGWAVS